MSTLRFLTLGSTRGAEAGKLVPKERRGSSCWRATDRSRKAGRIGGPPSLLDNASTRPLVR